MAFTWREQLSGAVAVCLLALFFQPVLLGLMVTGGIPAAIVGTVVWGILLLALLRWDRRRRSAQK